jgi:phosphate/phosphite/phosphonate ABC transporter binding protein
VRRKLTFGLYAIEPERKVASTLNAFCDWLGEKLDAEVACDEAPDYQTLADRVTSGSVDIAWMPPIVLLRAGEAVVPVVAIERGKGGGYETALVVREDSPLRNIEDLRGGRAAWVDEWSASGYMIPRLRLRLLGYELSSLFREEHFYGTHTAAVRAVLDGEADVAGTYTKTTGDGSIVDGPWMQMENARVRLLLTFGEIPQDVFAVSAKVGEDVRKELYRILVASDLDGARRDMVKELFGADGFSAVDLESYAGLRAALSLAAKTNDWDDLSTA